MLQNYEGDDGGYDNQLDLMDEGDYLQKEREIKELNDLRIRTLERLVKEKVDIIHQQEQELAVFMQDVKGVKSAITDKDKMLMDYERRLETSKHVLQQKDAEVSSTKMQLLDLYDQFQEE